jgi:uncharacterized membrane protein YcaP (DUF421 family)
MEILGFDIQEAFTPDVSPFEMFVRGTLIYLAVFVILRVALRRKSGAVAFTDLLVLVLIADAAQNGMAANYSSITDGLILIGTLVFWAYAIDWLGFHFPWFRRYVHPPMKALVEDGRIVERTLREELMTEGELMTQLRLNGTDRLQDVRAAYMEGNGQVSVLKNQSDNDTSAKPNQSSLIGG